LVDFHHSVTQINCLTGAIISETYIRHILRMNIFNDYTILHRSPPPVCIFTKVQAGLKERPTSWEDGREKRPLQNHWAKASVWR
jgi:hypothetical protein